MVVGNPAFTLDYLVHVRYMLMPHHYDARYWEERYLAGDTPWDIQGVSPALILYFQRHMHPGQRILIPGAGRAYEAAWLHHHGFRDITVCDLTAEAFVHLKEQVPDFPLAQLHVGDFFDLEGTFDRIIEQTFFCAIDTELRKDYVLKMASLLAPGGELAGLLFASHFQADGPPFGGTAGEYRTLFESHFDILEMDITPWSIPPRLGNELFFRLLKR
jgi:hypothetical protein